MNTRTNLKTQFKMGKWLGVLQLLLNQVAPFFQYFILAFSGIAAWAPLSRWILKITGFDFPFWLFGLLIIFALFLAGLTQYKAGWPSYFSVWNWQWWTHNNPMKKEMEELRAENKLQAKKLDYIIEHLLKEKKK